MVVESPENECSAARSGVERRSEDIANTPALIVRSFRYPHPVFFLRWLFKI